MSEEPDPDLNTDKTCPAGRHRLVAAWTGVLQRNHWLPFVLPFAVYTLTGFLEPSTDREDPAASEAVSIENTLEVSHDSGTPTSADRPSVWAYPAVYSARVLATLAAIVAVSPGFRSIPFRVGAMAVPFGVFGGLLWISTCRLGLEQRMLDAVGLSAWSSFGARPAFNPFAVFADMPALFAAFLAVRFVGLVAVVPLIEELFVRGFLMRFVVRADWWTIPLGTVTALSAAVVALYGVLSHPAEPIAAVLWFSLITLLLARTRNIWDCVVAHAITNGMLGIYILVWQDWTLW